MSACKLGLIFFCVCIAGIASAQNADSSFRVRKITIQGNKKTKDWIILRELTFKVGDTLINWQYHSDQSRRQLINLFLFNEIHISRDSSTVTVQVTERWYLWPIPILDYADRNFNQWLLTKDPKRLIYGVDLSWYNLRGRNETLEFNFTLGYTHSLSVAYKMPYFNKKRTWGAQLKMTTNSNRELWYATINDKVAFFRDQDKIVVRRQFGELLLTHRKKFFSYHNAFAGFRRYEVGDTVLSNEVNPGYLMYHQKQQTELYAGYQYVYDKRDFKGFPLSGHLLKVNFEGSDFVLPVKHFQTLMLKMAYSRYFPIHGKWFGSVHATGRWYSNYSPPYTNVQALGYGKDYIRGYELYVIDGSDFGLGKAEIKYRILKRKLKFLEGIENYEQAPLCLYLTGFMDAGYVRNWDDKDGNNPTNHLPNSLQNGGGCGLNLVLFYDYCMRLEYTSDRYLNRRFYLSFVASM